MGLRLRGTRIIHRAATKKQYGALPNADTAGRRSIAVRAASVIAPQPGELEVHLPVGAVLLEGRCVPPGRLFNPPGAPDPVVVGRGGW